MEKHNELDKALKATGEDLASYHAAIVVEYEAVKLLHQKDARIKELELLLQENKMDFQIQLRDGSWQESSVLPENPSCYKKAILIDGSKEVLTLEPVMDQSGNYRWAVK